MADVELRQISKQFGAVEVLQGIDLHLDDREFVVLVGPSGCGKSTLLRLVAGLEDPTAGDVFIGGRRVTEEPPAKRGIGMVFQSYALYPHMTAYDNMAFGLRLSRTERHLADRRVRDAARLLQIEHLLDRTPRQLSGGQRQRVAIGRAIVRAPQVLLFDEPLSNLDAGLRVQMRVELAALHRRVESTTIYVTHDQVEAMTLATRIVVLNRGRIEQIGTPLDLYDRPRNVFVAGFIGSPRMNLLEMPVSSDADGRSWAAIGTDPAARLPLPPVARDAGEVVTIGVRPEHVTIGPGGGTELQGEVIAVEPLGAETHVYVRLAGGETITARAAPDCGLRVAERIVVSVPADACRVFDRHGEAVDAERRA